MKLVLSKMRIDGGTQSRIEINNEVVSEYAEALKGGVQFPPVDVFFDGADYWLVDGFHRYHAHRSAGLSEIDAAIHNGTLRDAQLFSFGVNASHGLRRSNADKRKAVEFMLNDAEWSVWSDREIARQCCVSHVLVFNIRKSLTVNINSDHPISLQKEEKIEPLSQERTYTTKHGTQAVMKTANIGSKNAVDNEATKQVAPQLLGKKSEHKPEPQSEPEADYEPEDNPLAVFDELRARIDALEDENRVLLENNATDLQKELLSCKQRLANAENQNNHHKKLLARKSEEANQLYKAMTSIAHHVGVDHKLPVFRLCQSVVAAVRNTLKGAA